MENTNNLNSVNLSLSEYNMLNQSLAVTRDSLAKVTAELGILRSKEEDKVIIVEKRFFDPNYGGQTTVEKLQLDINDPATSAKLLEVISKVDTSELSQTIKKKEDEIKSLKTKLNDALDTLEGAERSFKSSNRTEADLNKEVIRKLKKGYEDTILDLEIDKDTLVKALADLKKDKTQQQIELARTGEIEELNAKINALETFKSGVNEHIDSLWKLRTFLKSVQNANQFVTNNSWFNTLRTRTHSAIERVREFTNMLKEVGELPEKSEKCKCIDCIDNDVQYIQTPWGKRAVSNW
jgi:hypothetical protein